MINSHLVALWINPFFVVNLGISVFDLLCLAKWTWFHNISICEHLCSLASVMSGSLQPHGLWPTRLDCPYDFPIKNTGMGCHFLPSVQFSSVQSLSRVQFFETPWIAAHQASLSITNSWSLRKLLCIELVMPSSHLILCWPLLLLPPISPSIRVFPSESNLQVRWPKYWHFSFSISSSNEHLLVL